MNWLDVLIIILWLGAFTRGLELGLVRQLGSTVGFFGGLFLGALAGAALLKKAGVSAEMRALLLFFITFGIAMVFSGIGEYIGSRLKQKIVERKVINKVDRGLGALLGAVALLAGIWLSASFFGNIPSPAIQKLFRTSAIVAQLDKSLPPAPNVIAKLGTVLDPNGFPKVFTGLEPKINTDALLPSIGDLDAAVQKDRASVVKIEGRGCGGIVEGSGFVYSNGLVATNAHVVAGVPSPQIIDGNGTHDTTVLFFDADLDLAVLHTTNLKGQPLPMRTATVANGTQAATMGYPGGGDFTAGPAAVLDTFTAVGRNIYDQGETHREVYSMKATVQPGNSGGPLVAPDGAVIGVVFAKSTSYDQVGYALAMQKVSQELSQAQQQTQAVSTGSCAE